MTEIELYRDRNESKNEAEKKKRFFYIYNLKKTAINRNLLN